MGNLPSSHNNNCDHHPHYTRRHKDILHARKRHQVFPRNRNAHNNNMLFDKQNNTPDQSYSYPKIDKNLRNIANEIYSQSTTK